jgi:hypothetical protein
MAQGHREPVGSCHGWRWRAPVDVHLAQPSTRPQLRPATAPTPPPLPHPPTQPPSALARALIASVKGHRQPDKRAGWEHFLAPGPCTW